MELTCGMLCFRFEPAIDGDGSYVKHIWGKLRVVKIAQNTKIIFLIRFCHKRSKDKAMEDGVKLFEKKPIILKA